MLGAQAQQVSTAAPTGDAKNGKVLYEQTYRCYACHGYSGETGSPRLVPMTRSEEAFIAYVRKPATAEMPSFADVSSANLADVYAYIRSLKPDAPAVEDVPLLSDILRAITTAK
jgi:mono/diheme cytochrome c family protein